MIPSFSSLAVGTLMGMASAAASVIRSENAAPRVELSYGTFQGLSGNTTESFLGIPFAQPP
jgi:acetylcholinesterase